MDQWDKRAAELGRMTVVELKELLFRKGAERTGKKADLVQRIVDYEKYLNFGRDPEPDNHKGQRIITPPMNEYKDLHGGCPLPSFRAESLQVFLEKYDKKPDEAIEMYQRGYLMSIRFAVVGNVTFKR
ncbi:hypothetical protein QAD02_006607 [Eretmocerus hayati]|uniref:Uncharacterized protein n=1 Tax=Eretmocerus hayati TaxID=131215 RepID=A0ACC2N1B4_9HYME|nr:hypothetical protein QAD02_006607 [Eretmocerus hayati]